MAKKRAAKNNAERPLADLFTEAFHVGSLSVPAGASASRDQVDDPFKLTPDQCVALDLTQNRVISASAGTGKTHTLTALYLGLIEGRIQPGGKLLSESDWLAQAANGTLRFLRPGQIVAVTFTEKAAAELLDRARVALERELQRNVPAGLREHLLTCHKELFNAPVSTIHSFCGRLLREAGADGPVPAAFTVLEAEESGDLLTAALASAAAEMLDSGAFPYLRLLARDCGVFTPHSGLVEVGRKLLNILRTRGSCGADLAQKKGPALAEVQAEFAAFYDRMIEFIDPPKGSKPSAALREACAPRTIPQTLEEARLLALTIQPLLYTTSNELFSWAKKVELDDPFCRILQECHAPFVETLGVFVDRAQNNYQIAKSKAGGVDFDDLMLACKALLECEKAARARERKLAGGASPAHLQSRGYQFVLIDEYQDTNRLQRDILFAVAFPDETVTGTPRLGVVGDVKQSIYGFRGADVTLMEEAIATFARAPLRENFRSRQKVIECFNALFTHIWPAPPFVYDEHHRLSHAGAPERHLWDGKAGELITWGKKETGNAARHRQDQAFAIARRIRTLIAPMGNSTLTRPTVWDKAGGKPRTQIRYGDIAILARTLKHLRVPLQMALASLRIPFRILRGMSFFTRPEIIDITNLWAVACDASDSFAVAGLLRSPFVGMSDAGFWYVSNVDVPSAAGASSSNDYASLAQRVLAAAKSSGAAAELSAVDARSLQGAAKILTHLAESCGRQTAVELLDWALTETGFLSVQALQPRGGTAVSAVRKAIELARRFESRGNRHLSDFVRWMRSHADAEWDGSGAGDQEFSDELPDDDDSVQIGTIHSAKGLEFPIVFFADAGGATPNNNAWALYSPEHGLGLKLGSEFDALKGKADDAHIANVEKSKREEHAERLRLLYVALTRTRDYFVILGEAKSNGESNWRKLIDDFRLLDPEMIDEVPANHAELRNAKPGDVSGMLEFQNGLARVRGAAADFSEAKPENLSNNALNPIVQMPRIHREIRVSVSRLALWLWCPRRAAFAAWEAQHLLPSLPESSSETPGHDAENARSGEAQSFHESQVETSLDVRALGSAVHAALEVLFGAEVPLAELTVKLAAEHFSRALLREGVPDEPEVKKTFDRIMTLARSEWGQRIAALPATARNVEVPFRWRISAAGSAGMPPDSTVVLIGQLDLLIQSAPGKWQVVDYKLASLKDKKADSESLTRYAWQAGLYARVAAQILAAPPKDVEATLAFLRDAQSAPQSVEALGHARISDETLRNAIQQFASAPNTADGLDQPAQVWLPAQTQPTPRNVNLCKQHRCVYVDRCYKQ